MSEIKNVSYRHDCYRSVHLIDRLSTREVIMVVTPIRLNFYRDCPRGRFSGW